MTHTEYKKVGRILTNLFEMEKTPDKIIKYINGNISSIDELREAFENQGLGKLSQSVNKLATMLNSLVKDLEDKKVKGRKLFQERVKFIIKHYEHCHPENKSKLGMNDTFSHLEKDALLAKIPEGKLMALGKAPLFFVSALPLKGRLLKVLKTLNANFYAKTNGVTIPNVSVLLLNLDVIDESQLKITVAQILKNLIANTQAEPVPFYNIAARKRNVLAIPCFRKEFVPTLQQIFEATNGIKLLIK